MGRVKAIHVVYANWCPHCVPTTVEPMKKAAVELGAECKLYDIDDATAVQVADNLVKKYGDWAEDYVIPQVFFELDDGNIKHVFSGFSEGVNFTKTGIENLMRSSFYRKFTES
jgi:thiol-disulfide isomerase/thioredoxin